MMDSRSLSGQFNISHHPFLLPHCTLHVPRIPSCAMSRNPQRSLSCHEQYFLFSSPSSPSPRPLLIRPLSVLFRPPSFLSLTFVTSRRACKHATPHPLRLAAPPPRPPLLPGAVLPGGAAPWVAARAKAARSWLAGRSFGQRPGVRARVPGRARGSGCRDASQLLPARPSGT